MKRLLVIACLSLFGLSSNANAQGESLLRALRPAPRGASAQTINGTGYFTGVLRVASSNCYDVRVGSALNSGFLFNGTGSTGTAQFRGASYRGSIRGALFRGRGGTATARGEMISQFTGTAGRIRGARVGIALRAPSGCGVGLTGTFRLR